MPIRPCRQNVPARYTQHILTITTLLCWHATVIAGSKASPQAARNKPIVSSTSSKGSDYSQKSSYDYKRSSGDTGAKSTPELTKVSEWKSSPFNYKLRTEEKAPEKQLQEKGATYSDSGSGYGYKSMDKSVVPSGPISIEKARELGKLAAGAKAGQTIVPQTGTDGDFLATKSRSGVTNLRAADRSEIALDAKGTPQLSTTPTEYGGRRVKNYQSGGTMEYKASGFPIQYKNPTTGAGTLWNRDGSTIRNYVLRGKTQQVVFGNRTIVYHDSIIHTTQTDIAVLEIMNSMANEIAWHRWLRARSGIRQSDIVNSDSTYPSTPTTTDTDIAGRGKTRDLSFNTSWSKYFPNLDGSIVDELSKKTYTDGSEWIADYIVLDTIHENTPEKPYSWHRYFKNWLGYYSGEVQAWDASLPNQKLEANFQLEMKSQAWELIEKISAPPNKSGQPRESREVTILDYVDGTTGELKVLPNGERKRPFIMMASYEVEVKNLKDSFICKINQGDVVRMTGIITEIDKVKVQIVRKTLPQDGCEVGDLVTMPITNAQDFVNSTVQSVVLAIQASTLEYKKQ